MKRLFFTVLVVLMLVSVGICGTQVMRATGDLTADASALTGRGNFYGVWIVTDGTNSVTFDIYDNTSATGDKFIPTTVVDPNDGVAQTFSFDPPIGYSAGVYVDITTTGTVTYKVYYNTDF